MKKIKKALLGVAMLSALTLSFGLVACDTTTTPTPGGDDHTTHVDTNPHDGICDVCEETIENPHPDENNDNLCDVGGESLITKTTYEYKVRTTDGVSQVTETMGMTFLKLDSAAVPYDFGNGDLNLMGGFMKVYRAYDVELTLSSDGTYELNVNQYMIEDDESSDIYDQKFEPGSELYAEWWSKSTGTYTSAEGTVSITSTYEYYKFPMLGALIDNNMSPSCSYARVTDADYYYGEWDSNYTGEGEDEVKEYLKAQFPDTTFTVEAGKIIKWKETGAEEPEPEEPEEPGEEEPGEEEPNTDPVVEDGKLTLKADGSATPLVLTAAGKATISVEIPGVTTLSLTSDYTWDGETLEIGEASGMGGQAKVAYAVAKENNTYTITATFNDGAMTFTYSVNAKLLNGIKDKILTSSDGVTPLVLTAAGKATISVEIPGVTTLSLTSNYTWDGENLEIEEASGMGGQAKVAYTVAEEDGTYTITATFNDGAMTFTFTVTATELNARFPVAE